MRHGAIGIAVLFSLLVPLAAWAENIQHIFTLKDFGLYAISSEIDAHGNAREERTLALARAHGLKRLSLIWYAPNERYPSGDPLAVTMLEASEQVGFWIPATSDTQAGRRGYAARLGYETSVAEITADYAKDAQAADTLYRGKALEILRPQIDAVITSSDPAYVVLKGEGGWNIHVFPENTTLDGGVEMNLYSAQGTIARHEGKNIIFSGDIIFPLPPPPPPPPP